MRIRSVYLIALLATLTAPARAGVQVNDMTDVLVSQFVPCAAGGAGEIVTLQGSLHTLLTATVNNNKVSGTFHFQPQGLSGVGQTTGIKYQGVGVTQETFGTSLQNGQMTLTFVNNVRIIGQGPGNNLLVHETLHIAMNADGTITVTHDNVLIDCR